MPRPPVAMFPVVGVPADVQYRRAIGKVSFEPAQALLTKPPSQTPVNGTKVETPPDDSLPAALLLLRETSEL